MCGIAALFGKALDPKILQALEPMTRIVQHRGPDGEGFKYFPDAALGHRRLAIVDLSIAGVQPMCTPDGRFWITYNGEIYNHKELRKELDAPFQTQTDTEILLAAYQKWGPRALHRLNGMFAFAIYDVHENTLFAARDRFGVKPLYYWQLPSGAVALASEIKQFTCLPGWKGMLNGQMGHDFLNWGVKDHTSQTLFKGVYQLRGGEYLHLKLGERPSPETWYCLPCNPFEGTFEEAVLHFRNLFENAVQLHLQADVPVGACLSGGLDSSSIVCLAKNNLEKTFSVRSHIQKYDESHYAQRISRHIGAEGHYITPSLSSLIEQQNALVWFQDEPFISTSQYAQWAVFELVKQQRIKVVLNGQGSDEQLAGYTGFFGNRFYDLFRCLRWLQLPQEMALAKQNHPHLEPINLLGNKLVPYSIRQPMRRWLGKSSSCSGWFDVKKLGALPYDPFWKESHSTVADQCRQQLLLSSLPMLLHYEDRNSMAHSVESRVPFLDYRLVEFLNGLPSDFKISKGWTKRVLREAMQGILPEEVRLRKDKMGFVTAEEHWMCQEAPEHFRHKIKEAIEVSQGVILPAALTAAEDILARKIPFNFLVWRLISFSEWMQRFSIHVT